MYLGLTARDNILPSCLCALSVGYVADLVSGSIPGMGASAAVFVCLMAHAIQGRMVVRGVAGVATLGLAAATAMSLWKTVLAMVAWGIFGALPNLGEVLVAGLLTACFAPLIFRWSSLIDGALATTSRDRARALEGLWS